MNPSLVLALAGAGALGTLARWGLSLWLRPLDGGVPWNTVLVNVIGCLLIGVVAGLPEGRAPLAPATRLILTTGFLGGFTTFSAWILESGRFLQGGRWGLAAANLTLPPLAGLAAFGLGWLLARLLARGA